MSTDKNKWIDAVGKLIELTQKGQITWTNSAPPVSLNSLPNERVDVVYEARFKDKNLRLYELHSKVERPQGHFSDMLSSIYPNAQKQYPYWIKTTVLELLDSHGLSAWPFSDVEVLDHLLSAVKYQVTGVKDFLNELLAEAS